MKLGALLFLVFITTLIQGQDNYKYLQIGTSTIALEFPPRFVVEEEVWDSVIYVPDSLQFELQPHYIRTVDYTGKATQAYSRQIYKEENGMVWQQVVKQRKKRNSRSTRYPFPILVNDSAIDVPTPVYRIDNVMQINPETLEEEVVVIENNIMRVGYDLGTISKRTFKQNIIDKFGGKINASGIYLMVIADSLYGHTAYYNKAKRARYFKRNSFGYYNAAEYNRYTDSIESLCTKIDAIKSNTKVIIGIEIVERKPLHYFSNMASQLAVFTLTD